jgi:hypothetical protein
MALKIDPSQNIPTASSSDEQWMTWHTSLKKVFGKKTSAQIWSMAWSKRGGTDVKANTTKLANHMEKQGVDFERTNWAEIGETFSDFGSGMASIWKWTGIIIGGVVLLILLKIIFALFKDPKKTMGQAVMFTPQGRALKAGSSTKLLK